MPNKIAEWILPLGDSHSTAGERLFFRFLFFGLALLDHFWFGDHDFRGGCDFDFFTGQVRDAS